MDSPEHILKFSLQLALFSSQITMRILSSSLWFVFLLFKALKCEMLILVEVLWLTLTAGR